MTKVLSLNTWLLAGILAEILLLGYCLLTFADAGEVFGHAARYSGRLSLLVYLTCFYQFAIAYQKQAAFAFEKLKKAVVLFCVVHLIPFGFLAANIYLNHIQLIPHRLAGGLLAYILILVYPFVIKRVKTTSILHFVYFYYVGLIMVITYLSRLRGQFEGAAPEGFHYFGLAATTFAMAGFGVFIISKRRKA